MLAIDIDIGCSVNGLLGYSTRTWWFVIKFFSFLITFNQKLLWSMGSIHIRLNIILICRVAIDTRQPVTFGIALLIDFFFAAVFIGMGCTFFIYYVGMCLYTRPFIDDLAVIMKLHSTTTKQRISINEMFLQFMQLHEDLYKYVNHTYTLKSCLKQRRS